MSMQQMKLQITMLQKLKSNYDKKAESEKARIEELKREIEEVKVKIEDQRQLMRKNHDLRIEPTETPNSTKPKIYSSITS